MFKVFFLKDDFAISKGEVLELNEFCVEVSDTDYKNVEMPARLIDGVWTTVDWSEIPIKDPFEGMTNEQIQAELLDTEKNIEFQGKEYTVNEADLLFNKYLALNDVARFTELSNKIVTATNDIYTRYPIEGQELLENTAFSGGVDEETQETISNLESALLGGV